MNELLTVSRGPVAATESDVQKAAVINALLTRPATILPLSVGDCVRPFAIGLFEEFRHRLEPEHGPTKLRRAIAAFVHTKRYYLASAQPDAMRHDIDGQVVEPVSQADRAIAQERFKALKRSDVKSTSPQPSPAVEIAASKADLIRASLFKERRT